MNIIYTDRYTDRYNYSDMGIEEIKYMVNKKKSVSSSRDSWRYELKVLLLLLSKNFEDKFIWSGFDQSDILWINNRNEKILVEVKDSEIVKKPDIISTFIAIYVKAKIPIFKGVKYFYNKENKNGSIDKKVPEKILISLKKGEKQFDKFSVEEKQSFINNIDILDVYFQHESFYNKPELRQEYGSIISDLKDYSMVLESASNNMMRLVDKKNFQDQLEFIDCFIDYLIRSEIYFDKEKIKFIKENEIKERKIFEGIVSRCEDLEIKKFLDLVADEDYNEMISLPLQKIEIMKRMDRGLLEEYLIEAYGVKNDNIVKYLKEIEWK